jgi:hypothetical protein
MNVSMNCMDVLPIEKGNKHMKDIIQKYIHKYRPASKGTSSAINGPLLLAYFVWDIAF